MFISLVFRFRSFSWFSVLDFVFFNAVVDILGGGREERVYYFGMEGGRVTGLRDCCGRWWHFGYFWCSRLGVVEWVGGGLDGTALSFFFFPSHLLSVYRLLFLCSTDSHFAFPSYAGIADTQPPPPHSPPLLRLLCHRHRQGPRLDPASAVTHLLSLLAPQTLFFSAGRRGPRH